MLVRAPAFCCLAALLALPRRCAATAADAGRSRCRRRGDVRAPRRRRRREGDSQPAKEAPKSREGTEGAEEPARRPLHGEPQGDVLAAPARRAGQTGQGQPEALRSLPALPPHRGEALDEPAAHAAALPDGPPLAGKRLEVVSGFRSPTVAKNPRSPHMKGLACDFRVEGVKTTELRDYLRKAFDKVGRRLLPELVLRAPRRPQGSLGVLDRLLRPRASGRSTRRIRATTCAPAGRTATTRRRSMNRGRPMRVSAGGWRRRRPRLPKDEARSRRNNETEHRSCL